MTEGALQQYVTIERLVQTSKEDGTQEREWVTDCQVYVTIAPSRGREYVEAQTGKAELTHRIEMWYRPDLTPKGYRIAYDGRLFEIVSVINVGERNRKLHLLCKETT